MDDIYLDASLHIPHKGTFELAKFAQSIGSQIVSKQYKLYLKTPLEDGTSHLIRIKFEPIEPDD